MFLVFERVINIMSSNGKVLDSWEIQYNKVRFSKQKTIYLWIWIQSSNNCYQCLEKLFHHNWKEGNSLQSLIFSGTPIRIRRPNLFSFFCSVSIVEKVSLFVLEIISYFKICAPNFWKTCWLIYYRSEVKNLIRSNMIGLFFVDMEVNLDDILIMPMETLEIQIKQGIWIFSGIIDCYLFTRGCRVKPFFAIMR